MDTYDPATVFSSIDGAGRYAYANQPRIAHWNITRLAETLLPLLGDDEDSAVATAQEALAAFGPQFDAACFGGLRRKIGLLTERDGDSDLLQDLLNRMAQNGADFTLTFRGLCDAVVTAERDAAVRALFADGGSYDQWAVRWRQRLADEAADPVACRAAMRAVNPAFIPRNHLVEALIEAAVRREDFGPFEEMLTVLSRPYEDQPGFESYALPPEPGDRVYQTFCGT